MIEKKQMTETGHFQYGYGILRIFACAAVVVHHVLLFLYRNAAVTDAPLILDNLLMCNNGLFFMLSGKFALENYDGNIQNYYRKKWTGIVLPVCFFSLLHFSFFNGMPVTGESVKVFLGGLLENRITGYLWFVYALVGFYLVVPFLAVMMRQLTLKERDVLLGILVFAVTLANVGEIMGKGLELTGFPFTGYIVFCLIGYLADHCSIKKYDKIVIVMGIISALLSCYEFTHALNPSIYDVCLTRILMCVSIFYLVGTYMARVPKCLEKPVRFVSGHTFYIYLMHGIVQEMLLPVMLRMLDSSHLALFCVGYCIGVFVVSLLSAALLQWIQAKIKKWGRKKVTV